MFESLELPGDACEIYIIVAAMFVPCIAVRYRIDIDVIQSVLVGSQPQ